MSDVETATEIVVNALAEVLEPEDLEKIKANPDDDMFNMGLDSLRSFSVLDELADRGVDVDFGEFTREPSLSYLIKRFAEESD